MGSKGFTGGVVAAGRGRIRFDFILDGIRYRPTIKRLARGDVGIVPVGADVRPSFRALPHIGAIRGGLDRDPGFDVRHVNGKGPHR